MTLSSGVIRSLLLTAPIEQRSARTLESSEACETLGTAYGVPRRPIASGKRTPSRRRVDRAGGPQYFAPSTGAECFHTQRYAERNRNSRAYRVAIHGDAGFGTRRCRDESRHGTHERYKTRGTAGSRSFFRGVVSFGCR
jgi:hypothetical protein